MIKMDHQKKNMEKTNSQAGITDIPVSSEATKRIQILEEKGLMNEIREIFRDKTMAYVNEHIRISENGKVRVTMIKNEFRDFLDNIEVKTMKIIRDRVTLINGVVIIRVVNIESVIEKYGENAENQGLKLKRMSNGSFRIVGLNRDNNVFIEL